MRILVAVEEDTVRTQAVAVEEEVVHTLEPVIGIVGAHCFQIYFWGCRPVTFWSQIWLPT